MVSQSPARRKGAQSDDLPMNAPIGDEFEALAAQADIVQSADLLEKTELEGVPLIITCVVLRPSDYTTPWYVSAECMTRTNRSVVFNDSGTGIRIQIMEYLIGKGIATPKGETADYTDYNNFEWNPPAKVEQNSNGDNVVTVEMRLLARKGLKASSYQGPEGPAVTHYLD